MLSRVDENPDSRIYVGLGYRDSLGTISWDGHMPVKIFFRWNDQRFVVVFWSLVVVQV